jgi:hypothetical protein
MHGMENVKYICMYVYHFSSESFLSLLPIISYSMEQEAVVWYCEGEEKEIEREGLSLWSSVYYLFFVVLCCVVLYVTSVCM